MAPAEMAGPSSTRRRPRTWWAEKGRTNVGRFTKIGRPRDLGGRCMSSICRRRRRNMNPKPPLCGGDSIPASPKHAAAASDRSCVTSIFLGLLLLVFKIYRIEERAYQGRSFQMLSTTLAFLCSAVALPGTAPLEKTPLCRRLDRRFVLGLRHPGSGPLVLTCATVLIGDLLAA